MAHIELAITAMAHRGGPVWWFGHAREYDPHVFWVESIRVAGITLHVLHDSLAKDQVEAVTREAVEVFTGQGVSYEREEPAMGPT